MQPRPTFDQLSPLNWGWRNRLSLVPPCVLPQLVTERRHVWSAAFWRGDVVPWMADLRRIANANRCGRGIVRSHPPARALMDHPSLETNYWSGGVPLARWSINHSPDTWKGANGEKTTLVPDERFQGVLASEAFTWNSMSGAGFTVSGKQTDLCHSLR